MGHSSVQVTARYARKLRDTHRLAVAATVFPESSPLRLPGIVKAAEKPGANFGIRTRDLRFTKAPLSSSGSGRLLGGVFPRGNINSPPGAWALALAAEGIGLGEVANG